MNASQAEVGSRPAASSAERIAADRPYPPSWLNRLIDWIERLPGPAWTAYLAIAALAVLGGQLGLWTSGLRPAGSFDPAQVFWGAYLPAMIWVFGHLQRVAAAALDTYRPALAIDEGALERFRYELTTVPAVPALISVAVVFPLTGFYYLLDPVSSKVVGYDGVAFVLRLMAEGFVGSLLVVIVYQTFRQLRLVGQLHRMPERVDVFQPRPLYAFSRLTSRIAVVLIVSMASGAAVSPPSLETAAFWVIWAPWLIGPPVLGVVIFVAPLLGMHRRLAGEKERVQAESDARLKAVLAELNDATDARDVSRAEGLQKLASAQMAQRDLLARLHTWPWAAGTLGALVPALALPVVVFLIQRVLAELLTI